jgi:hypothetical protein
MLFRKIDGELKRECNLPDAPCITEGYVHE